MKGVITERLMLRDTILYYYLPYNSILYRIDVSVADAEPELVRSEIDKPYDVDDAFIVSSSIQQDALLVGQLDDSGTDMTTLVTDVDVTAIDIHGDYAYFTERFNGTIKRVPLKGGDVETFFSDYFANPTAIVVDGVNIY